MLSSMAPEGLHSVLSPETGANTKQVLCTFYWVKTNFSNFSNFSKLAGTHHAFLEHQQKQSEAKLPPNVLSHVNNFLLFSAESSN